MPIDDFITSAQKHIEVIDLTTCDYGLYLKTEHWKKIRRATLDRFGNRCAVCNSPDNLQVHHRTYERRGHEDPGDTIALCKYCHARFHDKMPTVGNEGSSIEIASPSNVLTISTDVEQVASLAAELTGDVSWSVWVTQRAALGDPPAWIESAIREMVDSGIIQRKYAGGILKRYAVNGGPIIAAIESS